MSQVITAIFSDSWTHVWKPAAIVKMILNYIDLTFFLSPLTFSIKKILLKQTNQFAAAFPVEMFLSLSETSFRRDVIGSLS
jgi:hypothetical protein